MESIKKKVRFKPSHLQRATQVCAWWDLSTLLQFSRSLNPSLAKACDILPQKTYATCAEVLAVMPSVPFLACTSWILTSHLSMGCTFMCCASIQVG